MCDVPGRRAKISPPPPPFAPWESITSESMSKAKLVKKVVKPPESPERAADEKSGCDGCDYLKRWYKNVPFEAIRRHCGQHPKDASDMAADGLPPVEGVKVKREPPDEPPPELVDDWDGRLRPVLGGAGKVEPPESDAYLHLKEWAAAVRKDMPRLSVQAVVLYYRATPGATTTGAARLKKLYPDEAAAERRRWEQDRPPDAVTPEVKGAERPPPPPPAAPPPVARPKREGGDGRDAWGYKQDTRSARVNAVLMESGEWLTLARIEELSGATSVSSHLSSLKGAGRIEHRKNGDGAGEYRKKA